MDKIISNFNLQTTIVIPTYNRNDILIRVLPSYLNQKYVEQILIVDDGSSTEVATYLTDNQLFNDKIKVIRHNRSLGLCAAKNTGVKITKTPWILFGEDDLIISDQHIEKLHEARIKLGADIICGDLIPQEYEETIEDAISTLSKENAPPVLNNRHISFNQKGLVKPVELPFAHAIFMAPTSVLKKYLFSTRIGGPTFMREDMEMQLTLRKAGYRLFATPDAIAFHLAKKKGYGSGTRLKQSAFIHIASAFVNTWMVINENHEIIAPFFGNISKKNMLRKILFWLTIIEIKRWLQLNVPLFNKLLNSIKKFRVLTKNKPH